MRIGYDAKRLFYNQGGLGNYSRNTIKYLTEYIPEHKYLLYTPSLKNSHLFDTTSLSKNTEVKTPPALMQGVLKAMWRSWRIVPQLINDNIDIYHGLSNELPISIKKHNNIRTVVTIHDLIFLRYPEFYKRIDRWTYKKKFYNSSMVADTIIAVSQQTKRDLMEFYHIPESKIVVSYQGCDAVYFNKKSENEIALVKEKFGLPQNFIVSVGTIEERKNMLSILKALHHKKIKLPLVIVGKPTVYLNTLTDFISKHQMENQVYFIHNANNIELSAIYQLALMSIYPSVFEGFGIPVIESLASGTPVITTNYSSMPEAGGNAAFYITPTDTEEMATAINTIAESESVRQDMISKGNRHVQIFSGENVAKDLNRIYNALV